VLPLPIPRLAERGLARRSRGGVSTFEGAAAPSWPSSPREGAVPLLRASMAWPNGPVRAIRR